MEYKYYGEEKTIELMQDGNEGWLFYVTHNTEEIHEEYLEYCKTNVLNAEEEASARQFMDYREELFEEALMSDL